MRSMFRSKNILENKFVFCKPHMTQKAPALDGGFAD